MRSDREFQFNYRFAGSDWGTSIHASSPEEAKQKIKAVALARYQGEIAARVPVPAGNTIHRLWLWLKGSQP